MTFRHAVAALATAAVVAAIAGGCAQPHAGFVFEFASDMRNSTPPQNPGSEYFMGVCEAIRDLGPGAFMLVPVTWTRRIACGWRSTRSSATTTRCTR